MANNDYTRLGRVLVAENGDMLIVKQDGKESHYISRYIMESAMRNDREAAMMFRDFVRFIRGTTNSKKGQDQEQAKG